MELARVQRVKRNDYEFHMYHLESKARLLAVNSLVKPCFLVCKFYPETLDVSRPTLFFLATFFFAMFAS